MGGGMDGTEHWMTFDREGETVTVQEMTTVYVVKPPFGGSLILEDVQDALDEARRLLADPDYDCEHVLIERRQITVDKLAAIPEFDGW